MAFSDSDRAALAEVFGTELSEDDARTVARALSDFIDGISAFAQELYGGCGSFGAALVHTLNEVMAAEGKIPPSFAMAMEEDPVLALVAAYQVAGAVTHIGEVKTGGPVEFGPDNERLSADCVLTLIELSDMAAVRSGRGKTLGDKARECGIDVYPSYRPVAA
jgi:hypothetical protein